MDRRQHRWPARALFVGACIAAISLAQASGAQALVHTAKARAGTYTGRLVSTLWGTVQVKAVINSSGKISNVIALKLTDRGRRSVDISNQAAPMLRSRVLRAQSAHVSMVSGATVTSTGYLTSLQNALDQAGFTG
jgi:uncharacterized protein with FMN-binding domain